MRIFMKKCLRKKPQEMKPGAILDAVISQSSATASKCLLYKLADFKRGGDLIDAINTGGLVAVEQLIREQFGVFMYNDGKGQVINRAEFLRWKYRDHTEVTIPIEASLSIHDPLSKWKDHSACWQMQYRGALGESLLHVLIICDSKMHTKLARILLRVFPRLALDVIEGEEYLGASALHLAIAYSNNELVADLIEAGADINQRAIGSFFLPRDQQRANPAKSTDYEGLAYMGEYPLSWAACCANESVYNLLIDHDADPDAQDSFGNMILHMVVVCDKLDMFGYALRHPRTPAKNGIVNDGGLTPLTLACKLGRAEVFREMLELSAREFWRYSNITCSGYPLNALDTLLPDGRTNWNSALFIILNGTKEEHLDMLDGGIIQRLLEEKWKTFAQNQFLKRLLILVVHLLCLSSAIYLRPAHDGEEEEEEQGELGDVKPTEADIENEEYDVQTIARYCAELCTIAGVLSFLIFQQGDEIKNQGLAAFLKQLSHAPAKVIFLVSNLMILACIPFRLMGDTDTEEAILIFAVPGSWFLLMFFAGAIRLTGPFVTMIYSMITGDMFTFGIIYSIVLCGFSQAFYFLYKGHPQLSSTMFDTFPSTWMALFQTTLGDYNYPDLNQTTYPNLSKTVFVIFMIFVPILLLNMLIAMMGNTYAHVIEQSEKEWMKQWAKIVVTLERAVPQADAKNYLEAYSIPLGPSDDSGFEVRGVMVIKSKSKTRAKQRKGAVSNWKRVGRVTLNALKKRGMTGEEMRRLMWGRASISSPIKITKKKLKDPYNLHPEQTGQSNLTNAMDMLNFANDPVSSSGMIMKTSSPTTISKKEAPLVPAPDPLRDLILMAEEAPEVRDPQFYVALKQLANKAFDLVEQTMKTQPPMESKPPTEATSLKDVKLIKLPEQPVVPVDSATAALGVMPMGTNLTNLFQDPKDIVDPKKLEQFMKMVADVETEESDGGGPILGKLSLARRTRNALFKAPLPKSTLGDSSDKLINSVWDNVRPKEEDEESIPAFDFQEALAEHILTVEQEADVETEDANDTSGETMEDMPTVEEVHATMKQFHLRKRQYQQDDAARRAKTARIRRKNRVSPEYTGEESSDYQRGRSAPLKKKREVEVSPPDPLEPWSTRELQNINKILAKK
ncbi:transient receptor potential cation channel subfamily V member 1 [Stomoxys calcitrans]|uniref:transient receptor potential cation channel subfamily V member 1 n=1 Tax=Stomoxys calcitrans TaxID=35570 RepID=UPI0027E30A6B|nr:transient receptor potential cation channel subfamily V member 1 [Stomoxys calcitrans]